MRSKLECVSGAMDAIDNGGLCSCSRSPKSTIVCFVQSPVEHGFYPRGKQAKAKSKSHQSNISFFQISASVFNNQPISVTNTYVVIDAQNGSQATGLSRWLS
jgi:hypothetical protein